MFLSENLRKHLLSIQINNSFYLCATYVCYVCAACVLRTDFHTISAHLRNSETLIKWAFLRTSQPSPPPQSKQQMSIFQSKILFCCISCYNLFLFFRLLAFLKPSVIVFLTVQHFPVHFQPLQFIDHFQLFRICLRLQV